MNAADARAHPGETGEIGRTGETGGNDLGVSPRGGWPALPYAEWAPTKRTLHLVTQMVGKTRLALAPPQPEWLNACLYLDARGFSTGAVPVGTATATIRVDVFDPAIRIDVNDGRRRSIAIGPDRPVAEIWSDFRAGLAALEIPVDVWAMPQEVADRTPFPANRHDRTFDPAHAQRFHRVLGAVNAAFEQFRSTFYGRSGIQFWWGGMDHCVLLYTGRAIPAPTDRGYIMRYDLDAEHMNAGFWPGDDDTPEPRLFAYLVPAPPGCETAPMEPHHASWAESMGEWILPYDRLRTAADPHATILGFLESVYRFAVTEGGWDAERFRYERPRPAPRG